MRFARTPDLPAGWGQRTRPGRATDRDLEEFEAEAIRDRDTMIEAFTPAGRLVASVRSGEAFGLVSWIPPSAMSPGIPSRVPQGWFCERGTATLP